MKRVIIESPLAGDVARNQRYLRACLRDSLLRGEAPFASHAIYVGPLDDDKPEERDRGIAAGFAWRHVAHATIVYEDLGISRGMQLGIDAAKATGHPIERRRLGGFWDQKALNNHDFEGDDCDCAVCGEGWCHYLHDDHRKREAEDWAL